MSEAFTARQFSSWMRINNGQAWRRAGKNLEGGNGRRQKETRGELYEKEKWMRAGSEVLYREKRLRCTKGTTQWDSPELYLVHSHEQQYKLTVYTMNSVVMIMGEWQLIVYCPPSLSRYATFTCLAHHSRLMTLPPAGTPQTSTVRSEIRYHLLYTTCRWMLWGVVDEWNGRRLRWREGYAGLCFIIINLLNVLQ